MNKLSLLLFLFCAQMAFSQMWERTDTKDTFTGTSLIKFSLPGKFLTPPQKSQVEAPIWITTCQLKATHNGKDRYDGLLGSSYIDFGSVLALATTSSVVVSYRIDDGKPKTETWGASTGGTAAFLDRLALNTVLYGHFLPHRAGTNPPNKKLVVMVDEAFAAKIVAEFDIPDPDEMARICGTTYRRN